MTPRKRLILCIALVLLVIATLVVDSYVPEPELEVQMDTIWVRLPEGCEVTGTWPVVKEGYELHTVLCPEGVLK